GRLRHVARAVLRVGLAQVRGGGPRPEPAPARARLRRHLLLAPGRPGDAARGDGGRARHRGAPGQGAVRRRPVLPARGDGRGRGEPLARMALAWTLRDPRVTSTLAGASSVAQLEANVAALQRLEFSPDELAEIDRYATESGINLWAASSSW